MRARGRRRRQRTLRARRTFSGCSPPRFQARLSAEERALVERGGALCRPRHRDQPRPSGEASRGRAPGPPARERRAVLTQVGPSSAAAARALPPPPGACPRLPRGAGFSARWGAAQCGERRARTERVLGAAGRPARFGGWGQSPEPRSGFSLGRVRGLLRAVGGAPTGAFCWKKPTRSPRTVCVYGVSPFC